MLRCGRSGVCRGERFSGVGHVRSLAFDTTGAQCAVALWSDGEVLAHDVRAARHGHAALLAPMIAEVLTRGGLSARCLDRIGVTRGPGGFTGVRVGLATARGLALATGAPVVGYSTFAALLLSLPPEQDCDLVIAAVDSRLKTIFVQLFGSDRQPLGEPLLCAPTELAARLPRGARRPIVIGDAAEDVGDALVAAGIAPAAVMVAAPDAAALAQAAAHAVGHGFALPEPLYVAPPAVRTAAGAR